MLFMNYVAKQSHDAKDPDDWNLLQKTGMHNAGRGEMNVENLSYGTPCSLLTSIRQADVVACAELVKDRLFFRTSENRCENIRSMQAEAISCLAAVMYSAVEGGLPQSEFREYIQAEKKLISAFTKMEAFDTWFRRLVCDICFQVSVVKDKIQVPPDLDKCLNYINSNPCHKYTVDELADILGISKSTINRCFKKYLNTTPAKYIMDVKLQEAEKLLRTTVVPISEIAYTYGFSSQSHFSKCFAEKYQKTPLQYRKSHKSQK
jgi:AraC-like DNA-binding protein